MSMENWIAEWLWPFVRGDLQPRDFERWAYQSLELERLLPDDLYLATISTEFGNDRSVFELRQRLAEFARLNSVMRCQCATLPNLADVSMGAHEDVFGTLDTKTRHGDRLWWLSLERCRECNQWWLVAADSRINDVFLLRRLHNDEADAILTEGRWPNDFDRFSTVLQLGRDRGHRWRFVDPLSPSLIYTTIDLAHEIPDLDTAKLARLLQIDLSHAALLAEHAELDAPIEIIRS